MMILVNCEFACIRQNENRGRYRAPHQHSNRLYLIAIEALTMPMTTADRDLSIEILRPK